MRYSIPMATIDDVVRVSGISRSTVFRFLNGNNVRSPARESIQSAMKELNYFYNPRHSRSDIVIVVSVPDQFEGLNVYADMIAGVMSRADNLGLHIKLHAGQGLFALERKKKLTTKTRYGVVFIGQSETEEESEASELTRQGIPHVFVNRVFSDPSRSWVSIDLKKAARDATEHLISLGYKEIGTWGRPRDYAIDREKIAGYIEAFQARGLPVPSSCYTYEEDGDLEEITRPLFASGRYPRAWFGMSDAHLMRLVRVIREFDLRIPEDIALVGMDDIESSKFFTPPLSSVHIPFRQAGSSAVDALLRLIEDPEEVSVRIVLRHSLVVRESCGALK